MTEQKGRRPRVLIISTINRPDILRMFDEAREACDLTFLEYRYNWGVETNPSYYEPYGKLVLWSDFGNSIQLLKAVKPDKVVFISVSSYLQLLLNIVARQMGIKTYYLDHGLRLPFKYQVAYRNVLVANKHQRSWPEIITSVRNYWHMVGTLVRTGLPTMGSFLSMLVRSLRKGHSQKLMKEYASLRQMDGYISYSKMIFEYTRDSFQLDDSANVYYIGVPQYDQYFNKKSDAEQQADVVLFVGSQQHNGNLLGWNQQNYGPFIQALFAKLFKNNVRKILLRLHPGDVHPVWDNFRNDPRFETVTDSALPDAIASAGLIMGFFSTILLPMMAHPQATLFMLENHPSPTPIALSQQFLDAKVAHAVWSLDDLDDMIARKAEFAAIQAQHKKDYVPYALYSADGKAQKRLTDVFLQDQTGVLAVTDPN